MYLEKYFYKIYFSSVYIFFNNKSKCHNVEIGYTFVSQVNKINTPLTIEGQNTYLSNDSGSIPPIDAG